jgi:hypothetical protein
VLRLLPIANRCKESFAAMRGDDKTRFCDTCGKHVHDLSARSEQETRALLDASRGTRLCVRYARDASGAVLFGAATLAAAISVTSCAHHPPNAPAAPPALAAAATEDHDMGDMIPDSYDLCPEATEDRSGSVDDSDGCPVVDAGAARDAGTVRSK